MLFERKTLNDILNETPELRARGNWVCLNIETSAAWPTKPQSFEFEGHTVWVMPLSTDNYPGLALSRPRNLSQDDAFALLHRALSLLVWMEGRGAVVAHMSGGNLPRMMGGAKTTGITIGDEFDLSDLPKIPDAKASLALALMREGRGLNHPAYAFLSFYKVLEVAIPKGRARGKWVTENTEKVEGINAKEALKELQKTVEGDLGEHLLESGRQAIAHAKSDPKINPDDPRDARRLRSELPIIEALAVLAIEQRLGVQSGLTIWREHLYELRGWKPVFGEKIIQAVVAGETVKEEQLIDAPILNIRLRRSSPFTPLEGMTPLELGLRNGKIEIIYESSDKRVRFGFALNLATERLAFDQYKGLAASDDGTAAAARNCKELERFFRDYFGNGELQMWNAETGALISRCDAYIPVNMYLNHEAADAAIAKWDPIIAEREKAETPQQGEVEQVGSSGDEAGGMG